MAFLLERTSLSQFRLLSQKAGSFTHPSGLTRRGLHVEPGSREKALLAEDPALKRFKSHKKGVSRLKKVGDALTIVVVSGCCYEIYVKAVMREEARKQARGSA